MCQMGQESWWVSGLTPLLMGHAVWLASSAVATHLLAVLPSFSMHTCDHHMAITFITRPPLQYACLHASPVGPKVTWRPAQAWV